jgi:nucleoside-diphosphate-sugar epimerase
MNILITGAGGMVGSHLADYLSSHKNYHVTGTYYKPTVDIHDISPDVHLEECDIRYARPVSDIIENLKPEWLFHLAAQSYPTISLQRPEETFDTNVGGTINVFEAVRRIRMIDKHYDPVIVVACSSAEYGASLTPENTPVKEDAPLLPLHPYGVTKVTQDLLTYQYFVNYGIRGIRARIFNTTGPRKHGDAPSDFISRIIAIERGAEPILKVGNLKTRRALTDVRDMVKALVLLAEKGKAGDVYNISGEWVYGMGEIIDLLRARAKKTFEIQIDPALLRPTDEPIIYGDSTKLKAATGWKQSIQLAQTISDMLDEQRRR